MYVKPLDAVGIFISYRPCRFESMHKIRNVNDGSGGNMSIATLNIYDQYQ